MNADETVTEKVVPILTLSVFIAVCSAIYTSPDLSAETFWSFTEVLRKLLTVMTVSCVGAFIASLWDARKKY